MHTRAAHVRSFLGLNLLLCPAWTLPSNLQANTWQLLPEAKLRAADVYMSTRSPADQYGSTFKSIQGTLKLKREDANSLWLNTAALEGGESNQKSYGATDLKSRYSSREKTSLAHFDLSYRNTHGFEPLDQPIEEAAILDARSFESLYGGFYHQLALSAKDDLGFFIGGGRNAEGTTQTESRDAQVSWDHKHTLAWSSRWRLRITDADAKQREIMAEESYRYDEKLSAEVSLGYGWQIQEGDSSGGLLWGLVLQYQTSGLLTPSSAYEALTPAKAISSEQTESLRGSSLYRLGWTHSRDQRRVGDPFFYADIFYATARIVWSGSQSLGVKGSHSRASQQKVLDSISDYRSELLETGYDWSHRFLTRFPDAALGVSYGVERTELPPRRFFREIYQLTYRLIW